MSAVIVLVVGVDAQLVSIRGHTSSLVILLTTLLLVCGGNLLVAYWLKYKLSLVEHRNELEVLYSRPFLLGQV